MRRILNSLAVRLGLILSVVIALGFWALVRIYEHSAINQYATSIEIERYGDIETLPVSDLSDLENSFAGAGWQGLLASVSAMQGPELLIFDRELQFRATNMEGEVSATLEKEDQGYVLRLERRSEPELIESQEVLRFTPQQLQDTQGELLAYVAVLPSLDKLVDAEAFGQKVSKDALWLVFGLLLLVLACVGIFIHQVLKPVQRLSQAAGDLHKGQIPEPVAVTGQGEIAELAAMFNQAVAQLNRTEDMRKRFIADAAHELRTPITNLVGQVGAGQTGVLDVDDQFLSVLAGESERLHRLVDDLQQLAISDAGYLDIKREKLWLYDLLQQVFSQMHWHQEVYWENQVPDDLYIQADPQRMQQVFINLFENAYRYRNEQLKLRVSVDQSVPDQVEVTVSDNGKGFKEADLSQVFQRFYRGDASRSRETGGTGLGLAIAQAIIDAHGGHIKARHSDMGGAEICMTLLLITDHNTNPGVKSGRARYT